MCINFRPFKKTHIFIRIHKFMHRLVMPYLFIFSLRWRLNFVGLINKIHENWCSTNTNETTVFVFFGNTATISVQMLFRYIYLWRLSILLCVHCRRQVSDQWRVPVGLDGAPPGIVIGGCNSFPSSGRR